MMSFKVEINDLSKYRAQLMGVATLMIIACHAAASYVTMPEILKRILNYGNYGVDIFLLLSGLGCYYSLSKFAEKGEEGGVTYYKKRTYRILIPYLLVYIPYCLILLSLGEYSFSDCLLCFATLEFWLFHRGAWFVSLILLLYLFSPLLFRLLDSRYKWISVIVIVSIIIVLCNIPVQERSNSVLSNLQFAFSRMPCFVLGMAVGKNCKENKTIPLWWLFIVAALALVERKILGMTSAMAWATTPFITYLLIVVIKLTQRFVALNKAYLFLGKISLESYLTNITIKTLLLILIPTYFNSPIFNGRYLQYAIVIVFGLLAAYGVNRLYNFIQNNLFTDHKLSTLKEQ